MFVVAASLFASAARAEPDAGAPAADADALVVELDKQIAALSTGDCVLACQSLGSMRRTVDRICALDPGARCEKARDKVQEAARRVAAACPSCPDAPGVVNAKPGPAPQEAPPEAARAQEVASRKGGCAACHVGSGGDEGLGALAAALGIAALALRRRRR
jgi:MYXO-CTERM domain-containing protein